MKRRPLRNAQRRNGRLRVLFSSYHCYLDPSSGAALATRDLLELLASRGWPCRAFCGPHLDFEESRPLEQLLVDHGFRCQVRRGLPGDLPAALHQGEQRGVPTTVYDAAASRGPRHAPTLAEGGPFLALFEQALDEFRPDVLLTYGGHWLAQKIIARAARRGVPAVFALHNFAYENAALFRSVDAVLVPSRFSAKHYRQTLGLDCTVLPNVLNWDRVLCRETTPEYVTFVNPQPDKGVYVFARIAAELAARRPDIPLLVVEARGKAGWLERTGLPARSLPNLYVMANTPDPRDFYRVSRLVLMPSLWRESFGRVAAEALVNGIPVLASNRGALPETLAEGGLLFDVPERYTPESRLMPTAEEAAPWVEAIVRLWDDKAQYDAESRRAREAAAAWRPDRLGPLYEEFFGRIARRDRRRTAKS